MVTAAVVAAAFFTKSRLEIIVSVLSLPDPCRRYRTNASTRNHGNTEPRKTSFLKKPEKALCFSVSVVPCDAFYRLQSPLADHTQPDNPRRRHYRLGGRRRHGRQGPDRGRRQRPDARSRRDVRHAPRFEDDGVALSVPQAGLADSRAPVRRVRRGLGRLDARGRALHVRARRSVRLVPDAHARRAHQSLGPHLAAGSAPTTSAARASTASATTGRSPTTT